ncbi:C-terminal binding protein [Halostagnicola sp. A-GB9-2]|uniref:C-terminal binding protein n=1 Tax=Halostagnicola sp. A-GB9-2 TaxID=3048066 RepID=UPI0024BFD603|nr:C-terminal binding protein [Halostagnicola sp. A-GB9-2]MDJ1434211.1 C-terminal binding protein [Halostagnicola sp. A-GB9-2]
MTNEVRIVMLDPDWFGDVAVERDRFEQSFENVVVEGIDCSEGIGESVGEADILLTHYTDVPATAMDETGCAVVSRYATGIDGIDVAAASDRGVRVTRVPTYCDQEVGEHIITLALSVLRGLPQYTASTERGAWEWQVATPLRRFSDLTFGFIAYGRKAQAAAQLATDLGFDVCAYDPYRSNEEIVADGATPTSFDRLLDSADIVSINTPLTDETRNLFDAAAFGQMKDDAILVNTSRGKVVDESALLEALETGNLFGAGLDVLAIEPPAEDDPLLHRDDVFVTPHAAWYSETSAETLRRRGSEIAAKAYHHEECSGIVNDEVLDPAEQMRSE